MAPAGTLPRTARTRALRRALFVSVAFVLCYVISRTTQSLSSEPFRRPVSMTRHLLQSETSADETEAQPTSSTTNTTEPDESDVESPEEPSPTSPPQVTHSKVKAPGKNDTKTTGTTKKPSETKPDESKPKTPEDESKVAERTHAVVHPKVKEVGRKLKEKMLEKQGKASNTTSATTEKNTTGATTAGNTEATTSAKNVTEKADEEYCIPPAYKEFPPDLMSHDTRARGGVWVHILVVLYMFYALAVVCDDYFVASLEECCSRLNLSKDVAGATFMAAGSSAPELFTAILGVLIAKGDVGTGTIVGSAVFNVLFVIGICGIFAGKEVPVTWWPLFRDSIFYAFSVVVLILVIFDSQVTWYESLIMLLLYGLYITLMKYNSAIHRWIATTFHIQENDLQPAMGLTAAGYDSKNYSSYVPFNNEIDDFSRQSSVPARPLDEIIRDLQRRPTLYEAALRMMMTRYFRPRTRFWAAAKRVTHEYKTIRRGPMRQQLPSQTSIDPSDFARYGKSNSVDIALSSDAEWKRLPRLHDGPVSICKWIVQAPLLATLHYSVPDCRTAAGKKLFIVSFLMSIFWTAAFSYVMVWMVTLIGYTMGIPDSIMGITFLAAGTSIPDAFASLLVAKQGQGDMAIANSIGSNVFDILIGLALPWLIQTGMVEPGSIAYINSGGLVWSVVLLFLTIVITIYAIHRSLWLLTPRLGVFLLVVYVIFLVFCSAVEFNLLGYVNPPMCDE
ncbi:sodium/potassium/calcium exchanger 4-like [Ornithodoros turicata]